MLKSVAPVVYPRLVLSNEEADYIPWASIFQRHNSIEKISMHDPQEVCCLFAVVMKQYASRINGSWVSGNHRFGHRKQESFS